MKRRLLCILLTVFCLASFLTMGANADSTNPFVDVTDESAYYYYPVLWAYESGITTGTDATHFTPAKTCTRAEVVTFLWRMVGKPAPETTENPFNDIAQDSWYYDAVLWASEAGITAGTGDGGFSPDRTVTRSEFVTFLWRLDGETTVEDPSPFTDVTDKNTFYYNAVIWANALGITSGTGDGNFSPANPCSRGETVTFLYRYIISALLLWENNGYFARIDSVSESDGIYMTSLTILDLITLDVETVENLKVGDTLVLASKAVPVETLTPIETGYLVNDTYELLYNNSFDHYNIGIHNNYGFYYYPVRYAIALWDHYSVVHHLEYVYGHREFFEEQIDTLDGIVYEISIHDTVAQDAFTLYGIVIE